MYAISDVRWDWEFPLLALGILLYPLCETLYRNLIGCGSNVMLRFVRERARSFYEIDHLRTGLPKCRFWTSRRVFSRRRKSKVVAASVVNARLYWRICAITEASYCTGRREQIRFSREFRDAPSFSPCYLEKFDVWWMNFSSNLFSRIFIVETCRAYSFSG